MDWLYVNIDDTGVHHAASETNLISFESAITIQLQGAALGRYRYGWLSV